MASMTSSCPTTTRAISRRTAPKTSWKSRIDAAAISAVIADLPRQAAHVRRGDGRAGRRPAGSRCAGRRGGGGAGGPPAAGGRPRGPGPLPPAGPRAHGGGDPDLEAVAAGAELVGPAAGLAVERRVGVGARAGSRTAPLLLGTGSARALSRRRLRIRPLSRSGGAAIVGRGHRRGLGLSLRRSRAPLARVRRDRPPPP